MQQYSKKQKPLAITIVILVSLGFAILTAEQGLFNRPKNMFEELKINPFEKGSMIEQQVQVLFGNADVEVREKFDSLKHKATHDQYYRYVVIL